VVAKIIGEHKNYAKIKQQYGLVADRLRAVPNGDVIGDGTYTSCE
jgi:hypothetical protein